MFSSVVSVLTLAVAIAAKTISIEVGNGGIIFSPNSTTADISDTLEFHFYNGSGPHSVVMGMYDMPCTPAPDAFFSNYINGTSTGDETYIIPVNTTFPIWFYCSARKHCQNGMVGVVNPPSNATVSDYAAAARSVSSNVAPASTMVGGTYTTMLASVMTGTSSLSLNMTGSSRTTSSTVAGATSGHSSANPSSTSTGSSARKTTGVVGLMAAGGLAALMA